MSALPGPVGSVDDLVRTVCSFDRDACKSRLRQMRLPGMDFTEEFLESLSLDRLRHILMAAYLQAMKRCGLRR